MAQILNNFSLTEMAKMNETPLATTLPILPFQMNSTEIIVCKVAFNTETILLRNTPRMSAHAHFSECTFTFVRYIKITLANEQSKFIIKLFLKMV